MTTYGLLVFDDAEELDFVGPWEVFTASSMLKTFDGRPADTVVLIAEALEPVRCNKGMRVLPDHTLTDHPALDVVLVPGGQGTRTEKDNPGLMAWLAGVAETATWVTSVCTGSLLLHEAGPGRGRRLATHWGFEDALEARGDCAVVRDQRWVVDDTGAGGTVVTSQGVSAGIDMALWLVGQIETPAHARATQHYIQYDPAPPYAEVAIL
ncbi:MAG: DJ-1/PfpI family protein [Acidimicrobiales bacterium]